MQKFNVFTAILFIKLHVRALQTPIESQSKAVENVHWA